ncbi:HET-domain-containing protein [Hyaloscypha bicolor E]|uniref:HET-domain-containing protein n=1 Tax=Hyaloscypha bicolor E TaxID=1095630 RepID=A0A2J6SJZ1_9HELO|nr:HET-domain-containing protein [Hyaloscypha bicolor E]PMD51074.1 HET-domain-containing protein [Hyaloscypha bicolor E]
MAGSATLRTTATGLRAPATVPASKRKRGRPSKAASSSPKQTSGRELISQKAGNDSSDGEEDEGTTLHGISLASARSRSVKAASAKRKRKMAKFQREDSEEGQEEINNFLHQARSFGDFFIERINIQSSMALWSSETDDNLRSNYFINIQHLCKKSSGTPVTERSLYFALLRQWLQEYNKSHRCKPKAQFWPTRVIFVGDSDSAELELWVSESKKAQLSDVDGYVALSHCWGLPTKTEKEQFCTTQENYRHRLKGFSMDDLPKTFKDAVEVTRALGKQYLWIDTVCIIQSIEGADTNDWKIEARRMEQVFGSAYCTITTSSAEDWTKGFLEWRPSPRFIQDAFGQWTYFGSDTADYTKDIDAARLNQRAWVLQERVLSHRTIHFTESHAFWECGDAVRCENFTKMKSPPGREHFLVDPEFPSRLYISGYSRTIDFIYFLFEKYAQSGLTAKSDRVVAISGLVKRMELPATGDLRFDTEQERVLLVQVRAFQNYTMVQKDSEYTILDKDSVIVGGLSFDIPTYIHFQHCVVIGMQWTPAQVEDTEKTYHILLVRKIRFENQYERVGLGEIEAHYVSEDCWKGELC